MNSREERLLHNQIRIENEYFTNAKEAVKEPNHLVELSMKHLWDTSRECFAKNPTCSQSQLFVHFTSPQIL